MKESNPYQKMEGLVRKAVEQYHMIEEGDHIAVGVSGGKDSLVLLAALCGIRRYFGTSFRLTAVTLDPCFDGRETNYDGVRRFCSDLEVPYIVRRTQIGSVIFEERKEKNPCSLCARMRRGALHDLCREIGANKLALGHNQDDAIETFVMNLFNEGRIGCFSPVTWLSRKQITVVRPLIFAPEKEVIGTARRAAVPIVRSLCPADKRTDRERVKSWLQKRDCADHGFSRRLFGAMVRGHISGW